MSEALVAQESETLRELREGLRKALRIARQYADRPLVTTISHILIELGLLEEIPDNFASLSLFTRASQRRDTFFDERVLRRVKFFLIEAPSGNLVLMTHMTKERPTPPSTIGGGVSTLLTRYLLDHSRVLFSNVPKSMMTASLLAYPLLKAAFADYVFLHSRRLRELEEENISLRRQVMNLTEALKRNSEVLEKLEAIRVASLRLSDIEAMLGRLSSSIGALDAASLAAQLTEVRSLVEAQGEALFKLGDRLQQLLQEVREVKSMLRRGAAPDEVVRALDSIERGLEEARGQLPSYAQSNPWLELLMRRGR